MFSIGTLLVYLLTGTDVALAEGINDAIFKAFQTQYCESWSDKYRAICNKSQNSVDFVEAVKKQGASEVCGKSFFSDVITGATGKSLKEVEEKCKAGTEESKKIIDIHLAFFRGAKSTSCESEPVRANSAPAAK